MEVIPLANIWWINCSLYYCRWSENLIHCVRLFSEDNSNLRESFPKNRPFLLNINYTRFAIHVFDEFYRLSRPILFSYRVRDSPQFNLSTLVVKNRSVAGLGCSSRSVKDNISLVKPSTKESNLVAWPTSNSESNFSFITEKLSW